MGAKSRQPLSNESLDLRIFSPSCLGLLWLQGLATTGLSCLLWLAMLVASDRWPLVSNAKSLAGFGAVFCLAYIVGAWLFGGLVARRELRLVLWLGRVADIAIALIASAGIYFGESTALWAALILCGFNRAIFDAAKFQLICRWFEPGTLVRANGLFWLVGWAGALGGLWIAEQLKEMSVFCANELNFAAIPIALIGIASAGGLGIFAIAKSSAESQSLEHRWLDSLNPRRMLHVLWSDSALFRMGLGIAFFWGFAVIALLTMRQFAVESNDLTEASVPSALTYLSIGVIAGGLLAGWASGGRVELGLAPWGALLVVIAWFTLATSSADSLASLGTSGLSLRARVGFAMPGFGGAIFYLPLLSYVQQHSPDDDRSLIYAAISLLCGLGVALAGWMTVQSQLSMRQMFFVLGLSGLPVFLYSMWRVPQAMVRLPLWWIFCCLYRVRVNGLENIPANGGAVMVINHSTWIDGLIILLMSARRIRMIAWAGNFNSQIMKVLARFAQVILITGGPKSIQKGLSEGRKALQRGELVGIFPEGGISRTAQVRTFRPGLMRILEHMPVPIIPVYIDQIWGSIFSYSGGKSLWKWPRTFRHRLTINIGPQLWRPENIYQIRRAVLEEGANAVSQRQPPFINPVQMVIRACKKRRFRSKIADSTGQEWTGGMMLTRSLMLRDLLRRHVLAADEKFVGILIPPSTGGAIANMAVALDRRVAVNLNYTLSERLINECIRIANVKLVLTTRKVMEKFQFKLNCEISYLDDLRDKVTTSAKIPAMLRAFILPAWWLESRLGLNQIPPDELLAVIFTSGSTGTPKGVMLSHRNVASNVEAIGQMIVLNSRDTLIGALPFFHSFGFTITLWGAMGLDVRGAYHFNPLEANQVGKLTQKYRGTVLLGTPTFLRAYLRKCTPDDFASLDTVVAGAEKLPQELAVAFDHRFKVRPVEGYGTTELSPLVSVNVPPSRVQKNFQADNKEGTVGRTVPNVVAKITDLDDPTKELGSNSPGMLWIKGPNVMLGYLNRPDLTAQVIVDGWYCTGDVAQIDEEGFITLTGRMSRFSKIGGEMIPHVQIEDMLTTILNEKNYDEQKVAVTAVPDPKRGERLVVLHTELDQTPAELCRRLRESGIPNLFVPSEDSFFKVDSIPVLGTGKLDLRRMKEVALKVAGQAQPQ